MAMTLTRVFLVKTSFWKCLHVGRIVVCMSMEMHDFSCFFHKLQVSSSQFLNLWLSLVHLHTLVVAFHLHTLAVAFQQK